MASNRRTSLRDLRLASAANTLSAPGTASSRSFAASSSSSSSVLAPSSGKRTANKFGSGTATYQAAPRRTLQLATVKSRDWVSKADSIIKKANEGGRYKETRRQRKKRLWLARQESIRNGNLEGRRRRKGDDNDNKWAFLPDLVLEVIFQMLPYEVSTGKNLLNFVPERRLTSASRIVFCLDLSSTFSPRFPKPNPPPDPPPPRFPNTQSRAPAAQTCHAWFRVLRFRSVWSSFTVHDLSMTQQRFNFAGKFYEVVPFLLLRSIPSSRFPSLLLTLGCTSSPLSPPSPLLFSSLGVIPHLDLPSPPFPKHVSVSVVHTPRP